MWASRWRNSCRCCISFCSSSWNSIWSAKGQRSHRLSSGVTRFSGPLHNYPSRARHLLTLPFLPLTTPSSLPTTSRHPLPPFPTIPNPFLIPFLAPSLPLITARRSGERYSSPADRARPPNAFLCNLQPKICHLLSLQPTSITSSSAFQPGSMACRSLEMTQANTLCLSENLIS